MAYRSPHTIAESYSSHLISMLDFLSFFMANPTDIFTFVIGSANRRISIEEDTTRIMTELILKECMEKAQAESNEGDGKITTWEELVEKFFCKFYPLSHDGEDEMLDEGDNKGLDPLEFISRVNSIFENHRKMDGRTKKHYCTLG
ncbi:hypothetical protein Tco_0206666 [Tanacetum coccineum]